MGLHHRNLTDDEFTGQDLKNLPIGVGNPGAAPRLLNNRTLGWLAVIAIIVVGIIGLR